MAPIRITVLSHQCIKKRFLLLSILDDPDATKYHDTPVRDGRVTFEPSVSEYLSRVVYFEAHPRLMIDIGTEMSAGAGVVNPNLAVYPDVKQRDDIWPTICTNGRQPTGVHRPKIIAARPMKPRPPVMPGRKLPIC